MIDKYHLTLKEELIAQCETMGLEPLCVKNLIEEKWIFENKVNLILDILNR